MANTFYHMKITQVNQLSKFHHIDWIKDKGADQSRLWFSTKKIHVQGRATGWRLWDFLIKSLMSQQNSHCLHSLIFNWPMYAERLLDLDRPLREMGTLEFRLKRLNCYDPEADSNNADVDFKAQDHQELLFPFPLLGDDRRYKVDIVKRIKVRDSRIMWLDVPILCGITGMLSMLCGRQAPDLAIET